MAAGLVTIKVVDIVGGGVVRNMLYWSDDGTVNGNLSLVTGQPPAATPTKPVTSSTATLANKASAVADTELFAANANRLPGSVIINDSTATLYILLGAGVPSATNFTVAIGGKTDVPGAFFLPDGWIGAVHGIWAAVNGAARVTELTA